MRFDNWCRLAAHTIHGFVVGSHSRLSWLDPLIIVFILVTNQPDQAAEPLPRVLVPVIRAAKLWQLVFLDA